MSRDKSSSQIMFIGRLRTALKLQPAHTPFASPGSSSFSLRSVRVKMRSRCTDLSKLSVQFLNSAAQQHTLK